VPFPSCHSSGTSSTCSVKWARRCTARQGPVEGARGGDRPRMGTRARMLALFLYAGAVF
jgi:hypothetical protein